MAADGADAAAAQLQPYNGAFAIAQRWIDEDEALAAAMPIQHEMLPDETLRAWKRRALKAERMIENALRDYLAKLQEVADAPAGAEGVLTEDEVLNMFSCAIHYAVVRILRVPRTNQSVWDGRAVAILCQDHPMATWAPNSVRPAYDYLVHPVFAVDIKKKPRTGRHVLMAQEERGLEVATRGFDGTEREHRGFTVSLPYHLHPASELPAIPLRGSNHFSFGCDKLQHYPECRRALDVRARQDRVFRLDTQFQDWVRWNCNSTLHVLTQSLFKDLPSDVKRLIVEVVRDSDFWQKMHERAEYPFSNRANKLCAGRLIFNVDSDDDSDNDSDYCVESDSSDTSDADDEDADSQMAD